MKTAIYIEDGMVQLVMTPETDFEKRTIAAIQNKAMEASVMFGQFYDCRGGWVRQRDVYPNYHFMGETRGGDGEVSLIVRVNELAAASVGLGN